jgi:hypothetical protein
MKKHARKSRSAAPAGKTRAFWPLLITSIAVVLFSTAGMARMMGWGPDAAGDSDAGSALDVPAVGTRAGPRCPECGTIVSVREIESRDAASPASYEFVVRMADGSTRVIGDANPRNWREGERLMVIDGSAQRP